MKKKGQQQTFDAVWHPLSALPCTNGYSSAVGVRNVRTSPLHRGDLFSCLDLARKIGCLLNKAGRGRPRNDVVQRRCPSAQAIRTHQLMKVTIARAINVVLDPCY